MSGDWLTIRRGSAPLLLSIPHEGVDIPGDIEARLISPWIARKDTDWWVDRRVDEANWPPPFDSDYAAAMAVSLADVLRACVHFAAHTIPGARQ